VFPQTSINQTMKKKKGNELGPAAAQKEESSGMPDGVRNCPRALHTIYLKCRMP
jgi:hypothetical protein